MLAYVLALVIGLGSIALYITAFFFPEVHRKQDFIWSGVGLFYALVLWVCAGRITGGVLLGQVASVVLLGWFAWQTLTLRRAIASPEQQTPIPSSNELQNKIQDLVPAGTLQSLQQRATGLFRKGKSEVTVAANKINTELQEITPPPTPSVSSEVVEIVDKRDIPSKAITQETVEIVDQRDTPPEETTAELIPPTPPSPELVEAAQKSASPDTDSALDTAPPIEVIAPEVELAPPAEPPGLGDPEDRLVSEASTSTESDENHDKPA